MELTLQTIPRVKAGTSATSRTTLTEVDQERLYLATRAKDLLGYDALIADVTGERVVGTKTGKLTETMLKLEMSILDTSSVVTYQLEELTRRNREVIEERFKDWAVGWFTAASWQHTELSSYTRPVPEFVLDKAIKIKEALPEVKFYIHHLSDPKADPFLIASLGEEIYYVEAWDEPRFERSL
jgi:hypothetical protein